MIRRVFRKVFSIARSISLSTKIDQGTGRITVTDPFLNIGIIKGKNSKLIINGNLSIISHLGGNASIRIFIGEDGILKIDGDFTIGHGVRLFVGKGAILTIGGRESESGSGITSDSLIMAKKSINIGKDFVCAWGVFITDSDWHVIEGNDAISPVIIDDHVWIGNSCSVLKGSSIGKGSVVASHSKLIGRAYAGDSLIGGIPAKTLKCPVVWHRDM